MTEHHKPIAVCGIALRLPGGVNSAEKLWEALRQGHDMRGLVPESRYSRSGFSDTLGGKDAIKTQHGYFLQEDPGCFDSSLFSLTEEEISRTDPQQRLLLELAYECFENTGLVNYRGSETGVYVGTFGEDWLYSQAKEDQHSGGYILGGQADLMLANRLTYEYDLKGPSMVIKTGCSASLIALHEACNALQLGNCAGALVAGSNLILGPTLTAAMSAEGILSPEGSCKSFSAEADGFARGEAIIAIYLQRLDRAIEEQRPIRAVITNTGVNSNGRSASILQPSMKAQVDLMRKVYKDISCNPDHTAYVECHGTGTPIGDPIETAAVGQVFGNQGVFIGSMKPNFGHSEGCSGLSSLLKSIVMLQNGMIVPNIKFHTPNPKINFRKHKLQVSQSLRPWPRNRDFRISINSFGIGGSNAHVIVEHPLSHLSTWQEILRPQLKTPHLLLLSAATNSSLRIRVKDLERYVQNCPQSLASLAYTLARCRELFPYRTFAVYQGGDQLKPAAELQKLPTIPEIIMVLSGQGAQWPQMGMELFNTNEVFKRSIETMDDILRTLIHPPPWSIKNQLQSPSETSMVNHAEVSQPLCTALQIALIDLFASVGVKPSAVVGHSSGEIAAAYGSGAISREESIIISYYRGYIFKEFLSEGSMAAIGLDVTKTRKELRPGVVIACENSPESTTISGDRQAVLRVIEDFTSENRNIFARMLNVDVAYHSPQLQHLAPLYLQMLQAEFKNRHMVRIEPLVPMFSSVKTDEQPITATALTPEYWVANLLSPVKFNTAMTYALHAHGQNIILEIGPHSTLSGPLREICTYHSVPFRYSSSLVRKCPATHSFLMAIGNLFQHGVQIDTEKVIPHAPVLSDLPPYPWDHSTYFWYESRLSRSWRTRKFGHHELLGLRITSTTDLNPSWRVMLNLENIPWLADHKVNGDVVFPFTGFACMAGEAFRQVNGSMQGFSVRRMSVKRAMIVNVNESVEVVMSLQRLSPDCVPLSDCAFHFSISSYAQSTWIEHCTGDVGLPETLHVLEQSTDDLPRKVRPKSWYAALARLGLQYGPAFRKVRALSTSTQVPCALANISNPVEGSVEAYRIHPTVIDATLQTGLAALTKGLVRNTNRPLMPTYMEIMDVFQASTEVRCEASICQQNHEIQIHGSKASGEPCLHLRGLKLAEMPSLDPLDDTEDKYGGALLYWVPDARFQAVSSLIQIPTTSVHDRQVIEELSLLCIVNTIELVKDIQPSKEHLLKYRSWLENTAEEATSGKHPVLGDSLHVGESSVKSRENRIIDLYKSASTSSTMASFAEGIFRVYSNIQQLFTGQADVLELLLRNNTLGKIYDTVSFDYSRLVEAYTNQKPDLRILEVGAGTGGSTELILRGMESTHEFTKYSRYTFTDISAGFFATARERFAGVRNMDFKVLDISQDPMKQGFEAGSFDLIIAANVVHATPHLSQTLQHLRILLASGGKLLMTEFCTSFRAPNYIYGNFSGWWLGEQDDRPWEPYVGVSRWDKELKSVGLSGATDVVLDAVEPWHYCATIISQKLDERPIMGTEIAILCRDHLSPQNGHLMEGLQKEGYKPRAITIGDEMSDYEDIIATFGLEPRDPRKNDLHYFQLLCQQLSDRRLLWLMSPSQIDCVDPHGSQWLGMIRTARSELGLSITTLEINPDRENFVHHVTNILRGIRARKDEGQLSSDCEYAVHDHVLKVGRYRPFTLEHELRLESPLMFDGEATYLLTGGLGGLGRTISVWLAERGARHILYLSPNAGKKPQDQELFVELDSMGCEVVAVQGAAQREEDILHAISAAPTPIRGVLHLSMKLRDGPILEATEENWSTVVSPKVEGAWNLHQNLPELDFFVMASSLGTVLSQPGQSNYNSANTFLEAFCQYRHNQGVPASVLNICPIEDAGYVAENREAQQKLRSQGHWFLDQSALLKFIELSIHRSAPPRRDAGEKNQSRPWVNGSQIIMGLRTETSLDDSSNHASWRFDRRMGLYHNVDRQHGSRNTTERNELRDFVARALINPSVLNDSTNKEYLASEIAKKIFGFMMKEVDSVDISLSIEEVGLDSLMAIELRRWYRQTFSVDVTVLEILNSGNIAGLGKLAAKSLQQKILEVD